MFVSVIQQQPVCSYIPDCVAEADSLSYKRANCTGFAALIALISSTSLRSLAHQVRIRNPLPPYPNRSEVRFIPAHDLSPPRSPLRLAGGSRVALPGMQTRWVDCAADAGRQHLWRGDDEQPNSTLGKWGK